MYSYLYIYLMHFIHTENIYPEYIPQELLLQMTKAGKSKQKKESKGCFNFSCFSMPGLTDQNICKGQEFGTYQSQDQITALGAIRTSLNHEAIHLTQNYLLKYSLSQWSNFQFGVQSISFLGYESCNVCVTNKEPDCLH